MKSILLLLMSSALVACDPPEPTDTIESLIANPERLKLLREQCKTDRAKLGAALCNAVGEATRRRFIGDGKVPYTSPQEPPKF